MSSKARIGVLAAAAVVVVVAFIVFKGGDDNNSSTSSTTAGSTSTKPAKPKATVVTLKNHAPVGGKVKMTAKKGDQVKFTVVSDVGDVVHLHGYDIEKDAKPGKPAVYDFPANIAGVFEIESHTAEDKGLPAVVAQLTSESLMLEIAHGIVGRSDLPIPAWLFGWAAAVVLVVSFVGLAILWPEPKLSKAGFKPLPRLSAVLSSPPVEILCGAIGIGLFGLTIYSGYSGVETATANFASTFIFVTFWLGLVVLSLFFGDVFRAFNPWRALGRAVAWVAQTAARGPIPAPLEYPERLGNWPAAVGIFLFAMAELIVSPSNPNPSVLVTLALIYSAITFVAMSLYGVDAWCERGEAFSVYFGLFAKLSVWGRRDGVLGLRPPLTGLANFTAVSGTVGLLSVMIGTVSFDGIQEADPWQRTLPHLTDFFHSIGTSPQFATNASTFLGMLAGVLFIFGFYRLGILGAKSVGGGFTSNELARAFIPSLVPIALAYVSAHYFSLLLYQGQAIIDIGLIPPHLHAGFLMSNPLGSDTTDIFGTANNAIDYGVIGANTVWYWQVGFVVVGHVAALTLAHDKALTIYDDVKLAVRSQYWMLGVMVGFTSLALWLLSQANA